MCRRDRRVGAALAAELCGGNRALRYRCPENLVRPKAAVRPAKRLQPQMSQSPLLPYVGLRRLHLRSGGCRKKNAVRSRAPSIRAGAEMGYGAPGRKPDKDCRRAQCRYRSSTGIETAPSFLTYTCLIQRSESEMPKFHDIAAHYTHGGRVILAQPVRTVMRPTELCLNDQGFGDF